MFSHYFTSVSIVTMLAKGKYLVLAMIFVDTDNSIGTFGQWNQFVSHENYLQRT